ncbi:MAG: hypothetical protein ABI623_09835, partial [bacterium]
MNTFLSLSDTGILAGLQSEGVYRSKSASLIWIPSGLNAANIYTFAEESGGSILAGTSQGIYRSSNSGYSWNFLGLTGHNIGAIVPVNDAALIVGTLYGSTSYLFLSTNFGTTWTQVGSAPASFDALVKTPAHSLLAGTTGTGVYRSINGGSGWSPSNTGLTTQTIISFIIAGNGDVLCGTDRGIFRSTDDGVSWRMTSLPNGRINSFFKNRITTHILASTYGGGIYRSTNDGVSWESLGQNILNVLSALEVGNDSLIIGTQGTGIFLSSNNSAGWFKRNNGFKHAVVLSVAVTPGGNILAGRSGAAREFPGSGGGVYRSADGGENWIQTAGTPGTSSSITAKRNGVVFYSGSVGIYWSTDEGVTWNGSAHTDKNINAVCLDTSGNVYATAQWSTYLTSSSAVYRSTDEGESWMDIGACGGVPGVLAISRRNELFGVVNQTLYRRAIVSGCTPVQTGLPNGWGVRALAFAQNGFIFAAHDSGVFRSTNNGALWTAVNTEPTSRNGRCLLFNSDG